MNRYREGLRRCPTAWRPIFKREDGVVRLGRQEGEDKGATHPHPTAGSGRVGHRPVGHNRPANDRREPPRVTGGDVPAQGDAHGLSDNGIGSGAIVSLS